METKLCHKCGEVKSVSDFNKNSKKNDGLQVQCRDCTKKNGHSYYQRNKRKFKDAFKRRKWEIRDFLLEYKKSLECQQCGDNRHYVLDFHHINPEQKELCISQIAPKGWSRERIHKELEKCKVLCSNCHREYHFLNT